MIDKNSILVIEDVLPKKLLAELQNVLESNEFPWYYYDGVTAKNENPQFVHMMYDNGVTSDWWIYSFTLNNLIARELGVSFIPRRVKVNYQYPIKLNEKDISSRVHADQEYENEEYFSFIYYPFDSSGDTILYDHFVGDDHNDLSIAKTYTPKENSALFFYSHRLHASTPPTDHKKRIVFNFVNRISNE